MKGEKEKSINNGDCRKRAQIDRNKNEKENSY